MKRCTRQVSEHMYLHTYVYTLYVRPNPRNVSFVRYNFMHRYRSFHVSTLTSRQRRIRLSSELFKSLRNKQTSSVSLFLHFSFTQTHTNTDCSCSSFEMFTNDRSTVIRCKEKAMMTKINKGQIKNGINSFFFFPLKKDEILENECLIFMSIKRYQKISARIFYFYFCIFSFF